MSLMVLMSSEWKDEYLDFHCDLKKKLLKEAGFSVM